MKLKSLGIYKGYDDTVYGSMCVEGDTNEVSLKLNHEQCQRIIAVVAEELVEAAKELSQALLHQTIDFKMAKQIAAPITDDDHGTFVVDLPGK